MIENKEKNKNRIVPEILAPAGTKEALLAAVSAGCDAIYLGGNMFSARAFAGNFDSDTLPGVIDYCHLFGVKLYMTVNTLLKEHEILQLTDYMKPFYQAGLDGVIVQDPGVVRVLRRAYPLMPVHGSTQMSVASAYGANLLKKLGITRVVPARELSLEEIKSIKKKADIEIESFVHGAMCYAYSGKCLMSSFLGGRSGNRGRCAQPCRQKYEVKGSDGKVKGNEYAISLKDMCTLSILPQLIDAGIDSFKIEGRMKNPSYVAATVAAYKKARDYYFELLDSAGENNSYENFEELPEKLKKKYFSLAEQLTRDMQDIYNRGGFHSGYYHTDKGMVMTANKRPNHLGLNIGEVTGVAGPEVKIRLKEDINPQDVLEITPVGVELTSNKEGRAKSVLSLKGKELKKIKAGMQVYRTRNNSLLNSIEENIIRQERCLAAAAVVIAKAGLPLTIKMSAQAKKETVEVVLEGNLIEKAGNKPATEESLIEKMKKTGGSNVKVYTECDIEKDIFVPMSEFNSMRREAAEMLKQKIAESYHRK